MNGSTSVFGKAVMRISRVVLGGESFHRPKINNTGTKEPQKVSKLDSTAFDQSKTAPSC